MKKIYFIIILLSTASIFAQSHTFTGNGGSIDWHTATNWSANTVPSNTSTVLIPDGFVVNIDALATAQTLSLTGSGTLTLEANLSVSETLNIDTIAVLNYELGTLSAGTIENNGTIRFLEPGLKTIANTVINNNNRIDFISSNNINLSGITTINNASEGVLDILANGSLTQTDGALATLINNGIVRKFTENNELGFFNLILDVVNNGTLDVLEDSQFLFLSPSLSFHNTPSGILSGTGTFDITSPFLNEGTISPGGNAIGTLSFINTFSLDGGIIEIDIIDEENFDTIAVAGDLDLNGDILVNSIFIPAVFFTIDIITSQLTIDTCNFPEQTVADDNSGTIITYNILCEPNKVSLELVDGFIFSVNENFALHFSIAPNPLDQETVISLDLGTLESPQLVVYNVLGKKVKTIALTTETTTFSRDALASGMYFAQLVSNGKIITTEKIILK